MWSFASSMWSMCPVCGVSCPVCRVGVQYMELVSSVHNMVLVSSMLSRVQYVESVSSIWSFWSSVQSWCSV